MVEVPSSPLSLSPFGTGATILRAWAGNYGVQYGFTQPARDANGNILPNQFVNTPEQDAFRHNLVSAGIYVQTYHFHRVVRGISEADADRLATARALGLGLMNEM
jgi:hypothetical protein